MRVADGNEVVVLVLVGRHASLLEPGIDEAAVVILVSKTPTSPCRVQAKPDRRGPQLTADRERSLRDSS